MTAAIQKIIMWFSIIPKLFEAIKKLEEEIPLPDVGKAKLDIILGAAHAIYDAEQAIEKEIPWAIIESAVTKAASIIVAVLKSMGIFKGK
jgi:hypothetical protein